MAILTIEHKQLQVKMTRDTYGTNFIYDAFDGPLLVASILPGCIGLTHVPASHVRPEIVMVTTDPNSGKNVLGFRVGTKFWQVNQDGLSNSGERVLFSSHDYGIRSTSESDSHYSPDTQRLQLERYGDSSQMDISVHIDDTGIPSIQARHPIFGAVDFSEDAFTMRLPHEGIILQGGLGQAGSMNLLNSNHTESIDLHSYNLSPAGCMLGRDAKITFQR